MAAPPPVPSPTDVDANVAGAGADGAQGVNDDSCVMCTKQMPQCEITCEDGMACIVVEQTCTTCAFAECRVDTKASTSSTIAQKLPLIELVSGNGTATAMDQNCVMCTKVRRGVRLRQVHADCCVNPIDIGRHLQDDADTAFGLHGG